MIARLTMKNQHLVNELQIYFRKRFDDDREYYCKENHSDRSFRPPLDYTGKSLEYIVYDELTKSTIGYIGLLISDDETNITGINIYCKREKMLSFHKESFNFIMDKIVYGNWNDVFFKTNIENPASTYLARTYGDYLDVISIVGEHISYRRKNEFKITPR